MNKIEYGIMYQLEDRHWWYVGLHQLIIHHIRREAAKVGGRLKIFDAGCGTGRLMQLIAAERHDVYGCDISEEALSLCRERFLSNYFKSDLNNIELKQASFDLITSVDVLYHNDIKDDVAVLKKLRNGLKQDGMLILNLVAFEFLRSSHDIAVMTRERYTKKSLKEKLVKAGFTDIKATYRVSPLFPFIALYRITQSFMLSKDVEAEDVKSDLKLPNSILNMMLKMLLTIENRVIDFMPLPFGSSIFVTARKG